MRVQVLLLLCIISINLMSCDFFKGRDLEAEADKDLYFLGTKFGGGLVALNLNERELKIVAQGMIEMAQGKPNPSLQGEQRAEKVQKFINGRLKSQATANADQGKNVSNDFLKKGYLKSKTGLVFKIEQAGVGGSFPGPKDIVNITYTGKLIDGNIFSSHQDEKSPARFPLDQILRGWSEGIQLLKPGGVIHLVIPPELGYGESGYAPAVPGAATLIMDVKLISFIPISENKKVPAGSNLKRAGP